MGRLVLVTAFSLGPPSAAICVLLRVPRTAAFEVLGHVAISRVSLELVEGVQIIHVAHVRS